MKLERILMLASGALLLAGGAALGLGSTAGRPVVADLGRFAIGMGVVIGGLPLVAATIYVAYVALERLGAVGPKRQARARARAARPPRAVARSRGSSDGTLR